MDVLVLAIQLLSLALILFGAALCLRLVDRERQEAEAKDPASPKEAGVPAEQASDSDLHHGTPA